ncbi:MAG: hypothetical protein ABID64_04605 [Nitrospirota bacterium]
MEKAKKKKKIKKEKRGSGGGFYTPCENCGNSKSECGCFPNENVHEFDD